MTDVTRAGVAPSLPLASRPTCASLDSRASAVAALAAFTVVAALAACSADSLPLPLPTAARADAGGRPDATAHADAGARADAAPGPDVAVCGAELGALCEDGAACAFSTDCLPGSVCNRPDDPDFDPTQPAGVCRRSSCTADQDCGGDRTCGRDGRCRVPLCEHDGDCAADQVCRAGACVAPSPLPTSATCAVVARTWVLTAGERVALEAVVVAADGTRVPAPALTWRSSAPGVARAEGAEAVAVGAVGEAELTAALVGGPSCAGSARVVVRAAAEGLRVRVVEAGSGAPIAGATVWLVDATGARAATTDAAGEIAAPRSAEPLASVTAEATGRETVSILAPAEHDLLIPLGPAPEPITRGGIRGALDVRALGGGDIVFGLVAPPLPDDLSTFRLDALLGDLIDTPLDAPEVGLNDMMSLLPGGAVVTLGMRALTEGELRCQGRARASGEVGCFVTRLPIGRSTAWTYARRMPPAQLTRVAVALGQEPGVFADPLGLAVAFLPPMRGGHLGISPVTDVVPAPRVDAITGRRSPLCDDPQTPAASSDCRSDLAGYAPTPMAPSTPARLLSVVRPNALPAGGDGRLSEGVFVVVAASLPEGGWVPLGIDTSPVGADNRVAPADRPFGDSSAPTRIDELPLTSAPPHSGLEGRPRRVAVIAYDRGPRDATGALVPDAGTRFSGVAAPLTRADAAIALPQSFLGYAVGAFSTGRGVYTGPVPRNAALARLDISHDRARWSVYARPGVASVALPPLAALRTALLVGTTPRVSLHLLGGAFTFDEVFRAGSSRPLDQVGPHVGAFSAVTCGRAASALCRVRN